MKLLSYKRTSKVGDASTRLRDYPPTNTLPCLPVSVSQKKNMKKKFKNGMETRWTATVANSACGMYGPQISTKLAKKMASDCALT